MRALSIHSSTASMSSPAEDIAGEVVESPWHWLPRRQKQSVASIKRADRPPTSRHFGANCVLQPPEKMINFGVRLGHDRLRTRLGFPESGKATGVLTTSVSAAAQSEDKSYLASCSGLVCNNNQKHAKTGSPQALATVSRSPHAGTKPTRTNHKIDCAQPNFTTRNLVRKQNARLSIPAVGVLLNSRPSQMKAFAG